MTPPDDKPIHPDTPEWFIPYQQENDRQHGALRTELQKHGTEIGELRTALEKRGVEISNLRTELQKQSVELQKHGAEIRNLRTDITMIPQRVIEGLESYRSSGGGNPYSHDPKE